MGNQGLAPIGCLTWFRRRSQQPDVRNDPTSTTRTSSPTNRDSTAAA